jgi:hypothetical protein
MRPCLPFAVLSAALVLPGCPSMGSGSVSHELSSAQFADIPVPRGLALDDAEGRSFSFTEGGNGPAPVRLGRLEYTGRGTAEDLLAWSAQEMPRPLHGWDAGKQVEAAGRPALLFSRGAERCLVTVRDEGGAVRLIVERNTGGAAP